MQFKATKKRLLAALMLLYPLVLATPSAQAAWWWPFGDEGIEYEIKLEGANKTIKKAAKQVGITEVDSKNLPQNMDDLQRLAAEKSAKLKKLVDSKGYYDAAIDQQHDFEAKPPTLRYRINPGVRYKISSININWPGSRLKEIELSQIESKKFGAVDNDLIVTDAVLIRELIAKDSCLLSLEVKPLLKLHHLNKNAELEFNVEHGKKAEFGGLIIKGNEAVNAEVINRAIAWKEGECFDAARLDKMQRNLVSTQLFSSVRATPMAEDMKGRLVPIELVVRERVPRTISAGMDFNTDQGIGIHTGWEHRNFFGSGEKFISELNLGQQLQELKASIRIPAYWRDDQTLVMNTGIKREDTDVYVSESIDFGAALERKLLPNLNAGLGVNFSIKSTEDVLTGKSNYGLLSFPGFMEYDTRNDIMDATKGVLGRLSVTPYTETVGDGGRFIKTVVTGQTYLTDTEMTMSPTIALRGSMGSIAGQTGDKVPSDIRFYAGGSGSVRGFGYQTIGPRLLARPIGGASLIELSTELRLRFSEDIGGVLFVDGGNVTNNQMPQFAEKIYYGAGTGFRYYSPIGPIRLDVAFPVNGKDIGQEGYQLYVSIGQAF